MNKLKVIITYKGKQYCFMFEDEKMTINYKIHVLLSNKDSKNDHTLASSHYHYVCKLYNGYMLIPETSLLPHESAFINIKLIGDEFEKYPIKFWRLPLHAIGCQCDVFPIDSEYNISFNTSN
jgi:hypothetical protein